MIEEDYVGHINEAIELVLNKAPLGDDKLMIDWLLSHATVMIATARGIVGNDHLQGYLNAAKKSELVLKIVEQKKLH